MATDVTIHEARYVDSRAGNDKFYRTFVFGSSWVTQYGRNGSVGTFTPLISSGSPSAAQEQADAKFLSKIKKGYEPARSGIITTDIDFNSDNTALLDPLADALPLRNNTDLDLQTARVPARISVSAVSKKAADLTGAVGTKLTKFAVNWTATDSDLNPLLPVRPMLASIQPSETVDALMSDPAWVAQYKYDGDRVVIEVKDGDITVLNRHGEAKIRNVGPAHLLPFGALHSGRWVFDGEVVGRTLVLFDLLAATNGQTTWTREKTTFQIRYQILCLVAEVLGIAESAIAADDAAVVLAPVALSTVEKALFLETAIAERREGIILRHLDGAYESGRRSTTVIKHKLIRDADVIITGIHAIKQSAMLSVFDKNSDLIEIGAASTIGKGPVAIDDVWVVTYLYVTDPLHPRLFQPRLVRSRTDKAAINCTIEQFIDSGTAKSI